MKTGRSTRRKRLPGAEVRKAILAAAHDCFELYGFQKTSLEDIARAAGVSRPTVYKHFSGKQEIVDVISLAEMDVVTEELRRRMHHHTSFADTVTEAILLSVRVADENPYVRRFVRELGLSAGTHAPSSPFQIDARVRWQSLLDRARASGELATDIGPEEIVSWLSLTQMLIVVTGNQIGADDEQARSFIRRFVVDPLLAKPQRPAPAKGKG